MDLLSFPQTALLDTELYKELYLLSEGAIDSHINLQTLSSWQIGGVAPIVVSPTSVKQLVAVINYLQANNIPKIIIGDTTNLLFSDHGLNAIVVRISRNLSKVEVKGHCIIAEAGVWAPSLAHKTCLHGLSGLEHIVGIPGTLGGLVYMNGGSQRKCIGDNIRAVKILTNQGEVKVFNQSECDFSYRKSDFQKNNSIILECELELTKSVGADIRRHMIQVLKSRRNKFPKKLPNCGSVFVSNPSMYKEIGPPGRAIELSDLKGVSKGGAQISPMHANFIVNRGGATANDVLSLIKLARTSVFERTGFMMDTEVKYVCRNGAIIDAQSVLSKLCF